MIVYNGAFVIDSVSEEILISNYFDEDIKAVLEELISNGIYPIVYSYIDGVEHFSLFWISAVRSKRIPGYTKRRQTMERSRQC